MRIPLPLFISVVILFGHHVLPAQDAPVFSQFFANPFQFNPSYAAHNGFTEANVFYRKQWLGIENAPTVGAFNIQAPVGRNVALGLSGYSNKTILLNTNAALATFAYRVNLGAQHNLSFGISGGLSFNNFDLNAVANLNDPALANVVQKSQFVNGQFGLNYQFRNFNIGLALPKLFDSTPASVVTFDKVKFNAFKNQFASVSYNFILKDIQLTPMFLYRAIDTQPDQSQWEAMLITTYRKMIWVGTSYRDGYGITGFIGVALSSFRVGYAYEHPTTSINKAASASHEMYLGARLGKRNRNEAYLSEKKEKDSLKVMAKDQKRLEQHKHDSLKEVIEVAREAPAEKVPPVVVPLAIETPKEEIKQPVVEEKPVVKENEPEKMEGYYVVFGAYRKEENANKQMAYLRRQGLSPQIIYGAEREFHYVYTFRASDKETALIELRKVLKERPFSGAWIFNPKE